MPRQAPRVTTFRRGDRRRHRASQQRVRVCPAAQKTPSRNQLQPDRWPTLLRSRGTDPARWGTPPINPDESTPPFSPNKNQPTHQTNQSHKAAKPHPPHSYRLSISRRHLTFLPRPDQDGLPLAQQSVRSDGEEQAQAGRRPEGLRGRRPRARREPPQEAEVPRELTERRGEAAAAGLPPAEAGVPVGSRGREVLGGFEDEGQGKWRPWRCIVHSHIKQEEAYSIVRAWRHAKRREASTGPI